MKELDLYIRNNYNFNSWESLNSLLAALKSLSDVSQPQYIRRAAFLGYTTLANIMKRYDDEEDSDSVVIRTISMIIKNIIACFKDNDPKVVCSAAESLYNIMKYFSIYIIKYFQDIFEGLLLLSVSTDAEVRTLAQSLDDLLKEVINFTFQDNQL